MNGDRIQQRSPAVKCAWRCAQCGWLYWWNLQDIMRRAEIRVLPCMHDWQFLAYAFDLDGGEPPQEVEV
jgi:hypothetical protein